MCSCTPLHISYSFICSHSSRIISNASLNTCEGNSSRLLSRSKIVLSSSLLSSPSHASFPYTYYCSSLLQSACYVHITSTLTAFNLATIAAFNTTYCYDSIMHTMVYKPVAKKVRSVPAETPSECHIVCELPPDPIRVSRSTRATA
jgi:hypothetical protein